MGNVPIGVSATALDPSGSASPSATLNLETPNSSLFISVVNTRPRDSHGIREVVQEPVQTIRNRRITPGIPRDLLRDFLIGHPDIPLFVPNSSIRLRRFSNRSLCIFEGLTQLGNRSSDILSLLEAGTWCGPRGGRGRIGSARRDVGA